MHSSKPTLSRSTCPVLVTLPTRSAFLRRSSTGSMPSRFGQHIHHAFHREGRLEHAKAAEGAGGRVVGVHGIAVGLDVLDLVGAGGMGGGAGHHLLAQRGIRAGIAVQLGFHRRQTSIPARANLDPDLGGVPLGMHDQALLAVEEQLDRPPGGIGQQRGVDLPGNVFLAAKPAADQLADDAHALVRPAQRAGHLVAVLIGDLRADIDFHAPIWGGAGNAAFGLHKGMVVGRGMEGMLQDHVRLGKTALHITLAHLDVLEQVTVGVDGARLRPASLRPGR